MLAGLRTDGEKRESVTRGDRADFIGKYEGSLADPRLFGGLVWACLGLVVGWMSWAVVGLADRLVWACLLAGWFGLFLGLLTGCFGLA